MTWIEITVETPRQYSEAVSAVLSESGCAGTVLVDPDAVSSDPFAEWVRGDQDLLPAAGLPCRVQGYVPFDDGFEAVLTDVRERLAILDECGLPTGDLTLKRVSEQSWSEAWKAFFKPFRCGQQLVVCPTWEEWSAAPEDLVLRIDPGMAFGTGSHPTTQLCLMLLEKCVRPGMRVLDWGAGSGILSIGACLLGAGACKAIDLDPVAVRTTADNAAANGLEGRITAAAGSIEAEPPELGYDLILANIVADPIIGGASELYSRLLPGGNAVVSGFVERRADEVLAALVGAGLEVCEVAAEEDWRAALLRRP